MRFLRFFIIPMLLTSVSCQHENATFQKLKEVEALAYNYEYTSAWEMLKTIDNKDIDSEELTAFYNLLKAEMLYRCEGVKGNDSLINTCINYYQRSGDKEKLAASLYMRAAICYTDNNEQVLNDFKNAENYAKKCGNIKLRKRIYAGLTVFYGDNDEFPLSLQYARKEYDCAKIIDSQKFIAYALLNLSVSYDRTGQKDSAAWCILECEKLANLLEPYYQAYMYYGLGSAYANSDTEKAEECLKKSIELEPLPQAYTLLSDIYIKSDRAQMAKKMWNEVMQMPWYEFKVGVLDAKLEYDYQNNDFEEYHNTQKAKSEAMERYYENRLRNKSDELGRKYDMELFRHQVRSRIKIAAISVILIIVVLALLHRIRVRRIENRRIASELRYEKSKSMLMMLEERIAVLEKDQQNQSKELATLKVKAGKLKTGIMQNLQHGHDLYNKLNDCESIVNWNDFDVLCLLDFVSTINQEFSFALENDYDDLNSSQKLFLVVSNLMKKKEHEVCQIFGLEKQSLRNKRNRIEKKRAVAA